MNEESFNSTRIYIVLIVILLRILLMPQYLQAYLNLAHERIKQLKKEAGRINSLELQRKVSSVSAAFKFILMALTFYVLNLLM